MNQLYRDLYNRIADRLGGESAISAVSDFLVRRTRLEGQPFSFKHHEFQLEICNDRSPVAVIQKPTQVGMSELAFRMGLALMSLRHHFSLIYVLPSAMFAAEVSKTRIDPIIEDSEYLSSAVVTAANSALMKRIGSSILYMAGAATKRQAISRPAKGLILDEVDFCNQFVLTAYMGRLRHTRPEDLWIRKFSTPTVAEYGINKELLSSSRKRYMVKCERCERWQAPDFYTQVTIPGWDGDDFNQFTKDDLRIHNYLLAYLRCAHCGHDLARSLADPDRREWVAMHPDVDKAGYEVKQYDLIEYNPIPKTVKALGDYEDEADYHNFELGEVRSTKENQINREVLKKCMVLPYCHSVSDVGLCMGVDVGATRVYVTIGYRTVVDGKTLTLVVHRVALDIKDGLFLGQLSRLIDQWEIQTCVIDQAPDFSLSGGLMEKYPEIVHAANYVADKKSSLTPFNLFTNSMASIERTRAFNIMVKEINEEYWRFSTGPDNETFITHMQGMKRVRQATPEGDMKVSWVKTGEDHYMHACGYLSAAIGLNGITEESGVPVLPMAHGTTISQDHQEHPRIDAKTLSQLRAVANRMVSVR